MIFFLKCSVMGIAERSGKQIPVAKCSQNRLDYDCAVYEILIRDRYSENLIRRSGDAQYLKAWNKDDLDRLSIEGLSIENKESSQEKELNQEDKLGILKGVERE